MSRSERLASGSVWLKSYKGKHALKSYRKRYGTDRVAAAIELRMLGCPISDESIAKIKREVAAVTAARKNGHEVNEGALLDHQGDTFAFIAGYTSGGVPYGVTWEEMEEYGHPSEGD